MDILEAIKQREIEHQREHDEFGSTLGSCLPGGCDERNGDIPTLIQMAESLVQKLRVERGISGDPLRQSGDLRIDCATPSMKNPLRS